MDFLTEWQAELGNELLNPTPLDRLDDWFPLILSRSQVQQLIHSPSLPPRAQIALQTLYATGMRPQELSQLATDQFHDGWIIQQRPIAIQPQIQQNLAQILDQPITQSELDQWIQQPNQRLAELFTASQRQLTPQSLRNAFATHMLENGTDLFVLHHLLGHSNLSTTLQYLPIAVATRCPSYFQHHPLTSNPSPDTPRPTPAEVLRIIQAANTPRDRTLLRSYYATGLRRNELINLRYSDLNEDENRLFVRQGKDGKDRYALIDPQTLQQIAQLATNHKLSDLVFDLQESRVNEIFRQALQKSGLDIQLTLHSLRRAYATHCYANGMSLGTLKLLLGHAQLDTTTLYVDCSPQQLRQSYSLAQAVLQ